jgi:hypothetical protein
MTLAQCFSIGFSHPPPSPEGTAEILHFPICIVHLDQPSLSGLGHILLRHPRLKPWAILNHPSGMPKATGKTSAFRISNGLDEGHPIG